MAFSTLLDLASANGSESDKLLIAELIQRSDLLKILQFRSISGAQTTAQIITGRPNTGTRGFNQGIDPKVVSRSTRIWKTANFEEHSNIDVFIANSNPASAGGVSQYRADEDMEFLRDMTLNFENLTINGDQEANNTDFDGIKKFLASLSQSNVVGSSGGSGDETSIYFSSIGNRGMLGINNENSGAMPEMINNGRVSDVEDADGKRLTVYQTIFLWQAGLRFDEAGIGRVANVKKGATNLLDSMEEVAIQMKISPTFIMTSRKGAQEIQKVKTGVLQSQVEDTELKRFVTTWNGLPILITDSISSDEATVS